MILVYFAPILLVFSEAIVVLACRRHSLRRLAIEMLTVYLVLVGLGAAFAFIQPDEFGYSVIPLLSITAPWYFWNLSPSALKLQVVLGAVGFSIALFLLASLIVYSRASLEGARCAAEVRRKA